MMCPSLKQQRRTSTIYVADWEDEEAVILSKSSLAACELEILRFKEQSEPQDVEVEVEVVSSRQGVSLVLILQHVISQNY